ncbi:hypothetical protein SASPL_141798 [Salvia splendens]|uniref:Protein kinase domain-containing protein n=1 Tax=Salvia splendens TaxID=180675 RepID=A0A8X8WJT6_SALSN|nr:hypothetical protein SASPL_141798 [Salvia splendens]
MTCDFSSVRFLGEGGFGPVHKGFLDDKCRPGLTPQPVAAKLLNLDGDQGHKEWLTEVVLLGQLKHPHLVKLIGYCCEGENRLLVYERATDKKRPPREQNLVEWVKPYLKDHHKLDSVIDQRLEGQYSSEGAREVAALAQQCISHSPKSRPTIAMLSRSWSLSSSSEMCPLSTSHSRWGIAL